MDSEGDRKKSLLYADLFKSHKILGFEEQKNCVISEGSSGDSSSSSGFSTPFGSELGSFGSEDEEFMEELTRQMAECMLNEEVVVEQDKTLKVSNWVYDHEASGPVKNYYSSQRYMDSTHFNPQHQMSHIQVYQLKNQPPAPVTHGKKSCVQYRGKRKGNVGSGMKAIFLGEHGSGSSNGSSGTGVFLPRSPNEVKKKTACSTVLIPTRVLQTLELHYNRISSSKSPLLSGENRDRTKYGKDKCMKSQQNSDQKLENWEANINKEEEMHFHLPQEWTY